MYVEFELNIGEALCCCYCQAKRNCTFNNLNTPMASHQPRSQALLPSPPLTVTRKSLVAAGYVTTQNLDDIKICSVEGVEECFDCCCDKLCGFQMPMSQEKITRFTEV